MVSTPVLNPMACSNCGKKLAELKLVEGLVSIKCNKCGVVNTVESKLTPSSKREPAV